VNDINCENIEQVRSNIDRIDNEIVKLISERSKYVKQAAKFKKDDNAVKDTKRVEQVIEKVKKLGEEYGLAPDIVESVYRVMISSFIDYELKEHKKTKE